MPNSMNNHAPADRRLHAALDGAFNILLCRKALKLNDEDPLKAAEWLANGHWRRTQLVSWNMDSLQEKAKRCAAELHIPEMKCLSCLMDCAGNESMAKRKLSGLPVIP
jgi:hypothetical protein